jgi:hypothetical protein
MQANDRRPVSKELQCCDVRIDQLNVHPVLVLNVRLLVETLDMLLGLHFFSSGEQTHNGKLYAVGMAGGW